MMLGRAPVIAAAGRDTVTYRRTLMMLLARLADLVLAGVWLFGGVCELQFDGVGPRSVLVALCAVVAGVLCGVRHPARAWLCVVGGYYWTLQDAAFREPMRGVVGREILGGVGVILLSAGLVMVWRATHRGQKR